MLLPVADNKNRSMISMRVLIIFCMLLGGCSHNNLLTKQDYRISQENFIQGDAGRALLNFPRAAEDGTFITTMEQGYLSLIQGAAQTQGMQKQAALQENQVRYHLSREARTFFYVQTPEDYFPSEHEVIWLHFLLSWGYSLQGKYTDACVEARIASSLLSLPWSQAGHFDDATLRLFLAGLWTMCGDWHEAQVDLRAAWFMDNSLTWARELGARDRPPAHLFIMLGGPGPDVEWDSEMRANPLRSGRQVRFKLRGQKKALSITDQRGVIINPYLSPDASKWYERHLARESELHEMILDSTYGGKAVIHGAHAGGAIAASTVLGLGIGIAGIAGGVALVNSAGTLESILGGLGIAAYAIEDGVKVVRRGYAKSTRELEHELDPTPRYRFVRYLPEYLWMGWSDQMIAYPVEFRNSAANITILQPSASNGNSVTLAYMPEARGSTHDLCNHKTTSSVVFMHSTTIGCPSEN